MFRLVLVLVLVLGLGLTILLHGPSTSAFLAIAAVWLVLTYQLTRPQPPERATIRTRTLTPRPFRARRTEATPSRAVQMQFGGCGSFTAVIGSIEMVLPRLATLRRKYR